MLETAASSIVMVLRAGLIIVTYGKTLVAELGDMRPSTKREPDLATAKHAHASL